MNSERVIVPKPYQTERQRLEGLLRVALQQYPGQSEKDKAIARRFMRRDMEAYTALLAAEHGTMK